MATSGEVIRDVLIRLRVETQSGSGAKEATNAQREYGKEAEKNQKILDELAKREKYWAEEARRHNELAVKTREKLIQAERRLTAEIEKRRAAERRAAEAGRRPGVPGAKPEPAPGTVRPPGLVTPPGGIVGQGSVMESGFFKVATAVITATTAPRVILGGVTNLIRGIGAEIEGGAAAREGGPFTGPGTEFLKAARDFRNQLGIPTGGLLGSLDPIGAMITASGLANGDGAAAGEPVRRRTQAEIEEKRRADLIAAEQEVIRQSIAIRDTEAASVRRQVELKQKEAEAIRKSIEVEKQRVDAAREEFGFFNREEQQKALDVARKVQSGGIGSLNQEELEFARGNQAFKGLFTEFAQKNADAGQFQKLVEMLGLDRRQQQQQQALAAVEVNLKELTINVENMDKVIEHLEQNLAPKLQKISEDAVRKALDTIRRLQFQSQAANPGF